MGFMGGGFAGYLIADPLGAIRPIAKAYAAADCVPIVGSGYNAAVAEEGALKLQEVAYHAGAHGFLASELKHGHIALVEPGMPVIAIIPKDRMREKMLNTVSEALARGAHVIALTTGADEEVARRGPAGRVHLLPMPETADALNPILAGALVQLFAYHLGVIRENDIDKPRNLAKTVTVE